MATDPELMKVEESIKQKYLETVKNLSHTEMKSFKIQDYQKLVQNEIMQLLPDFDKAQLKETAHYVSNVLNNAVKELLPKRSREVSSSSVKNSEILSESVLQDFNTTMRSEKERDDTNGDDQNDNDDTENPELPAGCMDGSSTVLDDSIKLAKQTLATVNRPANSKDTTSSKFCDTCNFKPKSRRSYSMIRCFLCMSWYHEQCVGVAKDEPFGVWLCLSCRKVPQGLQSSITALTSDVEQLKVLTSSIIAALWHLTTQV